MKEISTAIAIHSDANTVWSILTDFASYPHWNPTIVEINGMPIIGERLHVKIEPPDSMPKVFAMVVAEVRSRHSLRWHRSRRIPGLVEAGHAFVIEPLEDRGVIFRQSVRFSGLLTRLWRGEIREETRHGLELMNIALKRVAEAGSVDMWKNNQDAWTSEDYAWKPLSQSRFYHDVIKAVRIIRSVPRPIESMSLAGWECGESSDGFPTVCCPNAISYGYHPGKLPADLRFVHPVLIGEIRGKPLVIDGCHRLAKSILTGQRAIRIVRLTRAETAACIRDGFERKVEFESARF